MAEIYRDSVGFGIRFGIPDVTPTAASIDRDGVVIPAQINQTSEGVIALLPYKVTKVDGKFALKWTYTVEGETHTKTEIHTVITPMFSKEELLDWDSDFSMLDDQKISRLERTIRSVIETLTGQRFNFEYDTITFPGSGGTVISLPKRLVRGVKFNDNSGALLHSLINIEKDGWGIRTTRGKTWLEQLDEGQTYPKSDFPILSPYGDPFAFREGRFYSIEGYFGYESIPEDIVLAAKLLAQDYGCDESMWRDRYIDNIRAADWRFEFHGKAFAATGNVKVDQILEKYTLNKMVVL